ncbi:MULTISPECIES: maleylpyruvate isomerase family mycothiol-dependent enzyme [Actinomadura]|uniref:Maleylpyruvate isomerase family mycothiol-dependent enzyme n=1 Tax=Actinomadura yumaensis TaxID=111807 RepID=A0ABW2CTN0_9ACTN|nr:maleylpyruvate isomerase family mycothiol-dependent enzyme [Actinomadura sp. J1-007]MWK32622.1 maleylpyruvate isomerase family mycothiol-dependent enzyme [Actinomadura sp. J1-007]
MTAEILSGLDPFDIFDAEADRLDAFFSGLSAEDWDRPSRCEGWSVRDVLAHLAGEELYNHACLDGDLDGLFARLEREGVKDLGGFNEWCVRTRRPLPVAEVVEEWREENGDTRRRMREAGADAELATMAGPYPVGLQTFHYCSEYATHGDDMGVQVPDAEARARTAWRARVGLFALDERNAPVEVEELSDGFRVRLGDRTADLTAYDFVQATVDRLPPGHPLDASLRGALIALA